MDDDSRFAYQLRIAKIELEHEVLLKEMEIAVTTEVALIIAVLGLIASLRFYEAPTYLVTVIVIAFASMLIGWVENYREEKKEKIELKQSEVDILLNEIAEQQNG